MSRGKSKLPPPGLQKFIQIALPDILIDINVKFKLKRH
jgi:hypothetical protein